MNLQTQESHYSRNKKYSVVRQLSSLPLTYKLIGLSKLFDFSEPTDEIRSHQNESKVPGETLKREKGSECNPGNSEWDQ